MKRYVLRRLLKVATEVAERTDSGRLLQREEAHELKALAPVLVLILGMASVQLHSCQRYIVLLAHSTSLGVYAPPFTVTSLISKLFSFSTGSISICHYMVRNNSTFSVRRRTLTSPNFNVFRISWMRCDKVTSTYTRCSTASFRSSVTSNI